MKICVVSGIFYPDIGGPATHLYDLCLKLVARGHKVTVITYGNTKHIEHYPFTVERIPRSSPILIRTLKFTFNVIRIGRKYELFYVDHYGFPVALANILLRKPTVIRVASDFAWEFALRHKLTSDNIFDFQKRKYPLKVKIIKAIQSFYLKKADFIIVPSRYMKKMVMAWAQVKEKIRVIHNAIRQEFRINISQKKAKKNLNLEGKIITAIARLIPLKGIDKLIEIIKELNDDIKLLIVGEGPEKEKLRQLTKSLGIENRVIFQGKIPRDKIPLYLKASDIFILNSETEGSPQVILEAMAVGVPIIATNAGGIPEIIKNGKEGLLIERGNPVQLKAAILRILEDEKLKTSIIENAQEKIRAFPFNKMVDEILGLFQYLALKKKRKVIFQRQLSGLRNIFAFFVFHGGILWLIQVMIDLMSKRERVTILAYHRVTDKSDFITEGMGGRDVSIKNFEKHIRYLKKNYKIISLDDFAKYFVKGGNSFPKKSAIITFDDGYQDNYTNVFPILKKYDVPAIIFLMTDFVGAKKLMWLHRFYYPTEILSPDEEANIASRVYLSWDQVKQMSRAGISIGSHTSNHQILSQLNEEEARNEILGSKDKLEKILGKSVLHFAYPFGDDGSFTTQIKETVRASGFLTASSRFEGINTRYSDPYALKRIGIGDCRLLIFASKLVLNEILTIFKKT